jgi:hypothetical protein
MKKILFAILMYLSLSSFGQTLDTVNVGTAANSGNGDLLRNAFLKVNKAIIRLNAGGSYVPTTLSGNTTITESTNSLNLASNSFTGTNLIFRNTLPGNVSSDKTLMFFPTPSNWPSSTSFTIHQSITHGQNTTGSNNEVMKWGFNIDRGEKAADPDVHYAMESNYNPYGNKYIENHLELNTPDGYFTRLFSNTTIFNDSLGTSIQTSQWDWRATKYNWFDVFSNNYAYLDNHKFDFGGGMGVGKLEISWPTVGALREVNMKPDSVRALSFTQWSYVAFQVPLKFTGNGKILGDDSNTNTLTIGAGATVGNGAFIKVTGNATPGKYGKIYILGNRTGSSTGTEGDIYFGTSYVPTDTSVSLYNMKLAGKTGILSLGNNQTSNYAGDSLLTLISGGVSGRGAKFTGTISANHYIGNSGTPGITYGTGGGGIDTANFWGAPITGNFVGMCATSAGNVYGCNSAGIYMQTAGAGAFNLVTGTNTHNWISIAVDPVTGNVWASVVSYGGIYEQVGGTGSFTVQTLTGYPGESWGICFDNSGNMYTTEYGGSVLEVLAGTTTCIATGLSGKLFKGIACTASNNVYVVVKNGSIWKRTNSIGSWTDLSQTSRIWSQIAALSNNSLYVTIGADGDAGDLYNLIGETGNFTAMSQTSRIWQGITGLANGKVYASTFAAATWVRAAGTYATTSITGNDAAGKIVVTPAVSPATSATIFTVTFSKPYTVAPYVVFSPAGANAAALSGTTQVYVTSTTTGFTFTSGTAALTNGTQYTWTYHVTQ